MQIEQKHFDEEVFIILQPKGFFKDWGDTSKGNVAVIKVSFSTKYFVPTSHDILVKFAPIKDYED